MEKIKEIFEKLVELMGFSDFSVSCDEEGKRLSIFITDNLISEKNEYPGKILIQEKKKKQKTTFHDGIVVSIHKAECYEKIEEKNQKTVMCIYSDKRCDKRA